MVFSDKDKILIKTHKYTQNTVTCVEELKSMHLECNLFAFSSKSAGYLEKIEFIIFLNNKIVFEPPVGELGITYALPYSSLESL